MGKIAPSSNASVTHCRHLLLVPGNDISEFHFKNLAVGCS